MNDLWVSLVSISSAIVGVAIIATLVSNRANTAGVIGAAGNAYSQVLATALSPVTGKPVNIANPNTFVNANFSLL
jgi:hypothetical protein